MEVQQPPTKIPRLSECEEEHERLVKLLEERLVKHDENRKAVQDKLHEICEGLRTQINELEDRINKELEEKFTSEDNRLQAALNELRGNSTSSALQKARVELLTFQSYEIFENKEEEEEEDGEEEDDDDDKEEYECEEEEYDDDDDEDEEEYYDEDEDGSERDDEDFNDDNENDDEIHENDTVNPKLDLATLYGLKAERRLVPELMEVRKPTNLRIASVNRGRVSVQFTCLNPDEERVLLDHAIVNPVKYKCIIFKEGNEQESKEEYPLDKNEGNDSYTFTSDILEAETTYGIKVKVVVGDRESEWSDEIAEFTPEFRKCCVWKKCPDDVDYDRKYSIDEKNPRVATKVNDGCGLCTIIGSMPIPLNTVTSWNIKVLKSENNDGDGIYVGIAPFDIDQDDCDNCYECGWYFGCYSSELYSGPPHNYDGKGYGPRKGNGQYVHTGDSVGVVVDTTRGDLSFVLNGVNLGVAYEGIPLDKPLVPCVLLYYQGDSVELVI